MKERTLLTIFLVLTLTFCTGCYHAYLQSFRSTFIGNTSRVHIERGTKKAYVECGVSYGTGFKPDSVGIADGNYYDFSTGMQDSTRINQIMRFPAHRANLYFTYLGNRLVSFQAEGSLSKTGEDVLFRYDIGIGARLYRNHLAGRIFTNIGLMKTRSDVFVFEKTEYGKYYDLEDSYTATVPFIEMSIAFNDNNPKQIVAPFYTISFLHANLFNYHEASVNLNTAYGTVGIFKRIGSFTLSAGMQTEYLFGSGMTFPHLQFSTQLGWIPIVVK
ncbi:MAG: hypothetical protein JW863_02845 [Chitinispirillaceae bacterium]|nr:hypothetical protein [Chitinispirillaceae bacterium]